MFGPAPFTGSAILLLTLTLAPACHSMTQEGAVPDVPGPSFEDVLELRRASSPRIAPDARAVVYQVRVPEWEENRYDSELWLARPGEAPFPLTSNPKGSSTSARWSPDSQWIAFLSSRGDDGQQLHVIRAAGGEARPVTSHKGGLSSFRWSPDGRAIAFSATDEASEDMDQREKQYGGFAVEDQDLRRTHLWVQAVELDDPFAEQEEPRRLTEGSDFTVGSFEWSPDGRTLAFDHRPRPLIDDFVRSDISTVDVESGEVSVLLHTEAPESGPLWSPDGTQILFTSPMDGNAWFGNSHLVRVPAAGGEPEVLAEDFDEDVRPLAWNRNGIFFLATQRTERHLFHVDPANGSWKRVPLAISALHGVHFAANATDMAVSGEDGTMLPEVFRGTLGQDSLELLTDNTSQVQDWALGTREVIQWQSKDGTEIEGVLYKPEDHDPSKPAPLLVIIHGGPTGTSYPQLVSAYVYPVTQWLAKGAVVLMPNYRGSAGYGEAFRALNVRNLGVGDAWDVLSGVDHLVEQGIADPDRLGAMGWSQGGYISAFLTTTTDRFRAISDGAGISNWMTYYVNTDIHGFTRQYLESTPWEDAEIYAKTSPMTYIQNACTPTLIQHGEFDRRVPTPNAYELYQGLQDVGVETRLIIYKGFGHGISKPKEQLAATWHNYQWFAKYVWGEDVELPLDLPAEEEDEEAQ